ncbi:MAG: SAM-dependent methyltransferase [Bacteroidales bacterium]|nr:SAM-dependent methyltransferase [Bacteroidales bacterium]MDE5810080.1 SAM-dependent methyltransferase [Muribaculaceae bacterium]
MNDNNITSVETALYLFPVPLADGAIDRVLPAVNTQLLNGISHFIVENVRSARRFIKKCNHAADIDSMTFYVLNRQTPAAAIPPMLDPLAQGHPMGVISEAGCPAVADPGADVVAIAQQRGYKVVPLVGPSSILMGLMGSGFNGQSFAFLGYLPIDKEQRQKQLRNMQKMIVSHDQTQIFIETPYRNNRIIADIVASLPGSLKLCVASGLTGASESVITQPLSWWAKAKFDYDKTPAIFLLYK